MINIQNKNGFTMAEVLVTLSIIGVIAAILFPSILADYNERTLKAKRSALVARMSQAMGQLSGEFRNYADITCTDITNPQTCTDQGSAIKFINKGLSKVYKVRAVCDNDSLAACDFPEEITLADGKTFSIKTNAKTFDELSPQISVNSYTFPYDTKSAAFMTNNGESILLFYNPNCTEKIVGSEIYTANMICVNMIFDLNGGKKKPNKMGEDIGFLSSIYSSSPYVVAPRPYDWRAVPDYEGTTDSSGNVYATKWLTNTTQAQAQAKCAALGDNVGLPTLEEAISLQVNGELWAPMAEHITNTSFQRMWTSTKGMNNYAWYWEMMTPKRTSDFNGYIRFVAPDFNASTGVRCVYKD